MQIPSIKIIWTGAILGALAVVLSLVAVDVAVVGNTTPAQAKTAPQVVHVSGAPAPQSTIDVSVSPGIKPGPDGKLHDAWSQTDFYVKAGTPVKFVINNTDDVPHSITAAGANVNIVAKPGTHTYTITVSKPGKYHWMCVEPCDPFSMATIGYMQGYIIAE